MRHAAAIAALCALTALACAGAPRPVELSGAWPERPGDFEDVTEAWTRSGTLRSSFSQGTAQLLELHATFKAPAWRAAYVDFVAERHRLGPEARAELAAEQKAAAGERYEVTLVVSTYHREHNDLQKGARSIWRVALVGADGTQIPAATIEPDRRPREVLEEEYPWLGDFSEVYVATFPRQVELLSPGADHLGLVMGSHLGAVELEWRER